MPNSAYSADDLVDACSRVSIRRWSRLDARRHLLQRVMALPEASQPEAALYAASAMREWDRLDHYAHHPSELAAVCADLDDVVAYLDEVELAAVEAPARSFLGCRG